jgi:hypothetical protein
LVRTEAPRDRYVDAVSRRGLESLGLPATYPLDATGAILGHELCQPIGLRAHEKGETGIACLSAAPAAPVGGEELAYLGSRRLPVVGAETFGEWFWAGPRVSQAT